LLLSYGLLALPGEEGEVLEVYTSVSKTSPSSIVGILNCIVAMVVVDLMRWSSRADGGQLKISYRTVLEHGAVVC